eukprot:7995263-Lingulodinium_polyedra.AAC.1
MFRAFHARAAAQRRGQSAGIADCAVLQWRKPFPRAFLGSCSIALVMVPVFHARAAQRRRGREGRGSRIVPRCSYGKRFRSVNCV